MIRRIAHVCILSRDLDAAERFYCGALGMRKGFEFRKAGELVGFYLDAGGGCHIEVFRGEGQPDAPSPIRHFCLETDDLDAVKRRLAEHGVESTEKTLPCDHSWQIWCKDPDGISIEFHQYTADSLQLTGGVAEIG
jgi:catechol 2,3-dioxygenase-like lactoylglutathione lyase family enzyme